MWFTVVVGVARGCSGCWRAGATASPAGAAAGALDRGRRARTDAARRRQRAPVRVFIPALVALAALALGRDRALLPEAVATIPRRQCAAGAAARLLRAVRRHRRRSSGSRHLYEVGPERPARRRRWRLLCTAADLRDLAAAAAAAARARRGARRAALLVAALVAAGPARAVRAVGGGPDLQELRGVGRARPGAAAGHARPRQARQRAGAREPDQADLRRPRLRQLRGPEDGATMCDIF